MLAKLVSGTWKEGDGANEIFIDRDGERFKYILDYLRNDRVHLPDIPSQKALEADFDYFGIDADMSKISVMDDFSAIEELNLQILEHIKDIKEKKMRVAAIRESYRLANKFSRFAEGGHARLLIEEDINKKILSSCLLARGLHVIRFDMKKESGTHVLLCIPSMKSTWV
ncbi:hypothetical protein FisN_14Hu061 [Fistulifera solaris]|uniref:Potassium channel tetramerisation-type BTB domain-containing protein n=1 Tax=Fistulifera solaris TaxID=1519565 RepID=A0A1Z5K884_FISSO|nr:hypothetical protein FisN_14Hu061 [Fistulifera solaris]|eukprot:GAX22447.1 hypothetical protein FisN_14Hu061 [Fistulifera solaris]